MPADAVSGSAIPEDSEAEVLGEARVRQRAEEASWRQAAGVRPTMPATSAKE